ncbi:MAG: DNA repair protein RadC [Desulfobulbaceae bacterium]|nr:MAG: DNA repair protein RadC [Desulfobulbaceae bacterium]
MSGGSEESRTTGHRQRLRDRFIENGIQAFNDTEILEILLSFGTPRKDCKLEARSLLKSFGSLAAVLDAESSQLQKTKGVGPKNGFAIEFIKSIANRYLQKRIQAKNYLSSSAEVVDYLSHSMKGLPVEIFKVIYLDSSHAIIDSETVAEGTVNINNVYTREIIKRALKRNAVALIVAHNHPSGSLTPSAQDQHLTRSLALACIMMQMRLLDHIIIGDGHYSFADQGILTEINTWCNSITSDQL